jgi:hypothetical protein
VAAVVAAVRKKQSAPLMLAILGGAAALVVRKDPQWTLYNVRFLPFYMLCVYLLAGYAVAEAGAAAARGLRLLRLALWRDSVDSAAAWTPPPPVPAPLALATAFAGGGPGVAVFEPAGPVAAEGPVPPGTARPPRNALPPRTWPRPRFGPWAPGAVAVPLVAMLGALMVVLPPLVPWLDNKVGSVLHHEFTPSNVAGWATWNYSGYQATPGAKELYDGIIPTMQKVGDRYGCGRAMWEYNSDLNRFGTPESLMLLPYWTNNCIDSLEGVLFESSGTTPYHFLNQAELSVAPSEAVVATTTGLRYGSLDVALGVEHLQLLGIKYFMASSPVVQAQAAVDSDLTLVASTGPWKSDYPGTPATTTWKVYEVHDAAIVKPLTETPDVLTATGAGQKSWLPVAQKWYADPARWDQQLVTGGPASWARTSTPSDPPAGQPLPAVQVTDVKVGTDTLSFHVSRTGVPVAVGISYFPNWKVTGAAGPWRSEPNLMVVDPTSHDVTLTYGSSGADDLGLVLTVVGLGVVVVLYRRRSFVTGWSPPAGRAGRRWGGRR